MKTTIQTLKEDLSKAKSKCELHLKYEEKMIKTKIATTKRINAQHRQNIQKEKERVVDLREREDKVYSKIMTYLNSEQDHINDKYTTWNVRDLEISLTALGQARD
jgi:hypothetical protein